MESIGQSRLKVAIVGCGKIAEAHVEAIQATPDTAVLSAVCDLEPLMAERLAARYGIAGSYDSLEALLARERPDVVHVTTPPGAHFEIAMQAMEAGCHVYVEKPLALDHEQAKRLVDTAIATERKLTVGYSTFYDPVAIEMRDWIRRGALGEPVHVESFFGYPLSGPFGSAILGDERHWVHGMPGKLLQNNLDHLLVKVAEFLDDDALRIHATGYSLRGERFLDSRDEMLDELRVLIVGGRVSAYGTFSCHARPLAHFVRVYGTQGTLHVDYVSRTVTFERAPLELGVLGRAILPFPQAGRLLSAGLRNLARFTRSEFHYFSGLRRLITLFYASILDGSHPPIAYRDILRISGIMQAILAQVPQAGTK